MPVLCPYYANVKCHLRPVVVLSEDCDSFKSICNLNEKMPNHAKNWLKGHKRSERHVMQPWTRHATDTAPTWWWQFSATLQPTFCVDEVASWHDCDGLNLLHSNPLCSNEVAILLCKISSYRVEATDTSYDPLFVQCGNVRCYWRWIIPKCRVITRYAQYYPHRRFCIREEWGQIVTTWQCICDKLMNLRSQIMQIE